MSHNQNKYWQFFLIYGSFSDFSKSSFKMITCYTQFYPYFLLLLLLTMHFFFILKLIRIDYYMNSN